MHLKKYQTSGVKIAMKKEDLEKNGISKMSIKNKYIYYPLYDTDRNSYMRRYRLWMRYREACKRDGRPYMDCTTFGKIIQEVNSRAIHYIVNDPAGVSFSKFNLTLEFKKIKRSNENIKYRKYLQNGLLYPMVKLTSKLKKRKNFTISDYRFEASEKIKQMVKDANLDAGNYEVVNNKTPEKFDYDDMFNDLK